MKSHVPGEGWGQRVNLERTNISWPGQKGITTFTH